MIKEVIGEASTIEAAKENALARLAAPEGTDVKLEIVSRPQKKVLGLFGGSLAKIKAFYDDGKAEPKVTESKVVTQPKVAAAEKAQPKQNAQTKAPVPPQASQPVATPQAVVTTKAETQTTKHCPPKRRADAGPPSAGMTKSAVAYLEMMLAGLSVTDATITATESEEGITLHIDCDDHGIIIGRRGETMDAMQYLVSLVINTDSTTYVRITLNVGNYREKRQEALIGVAKRNADHVLHTGRRAVLEPMNPYERRIIHTAVQDIKGVSSRSVGSNNERKVVIELNEGVQPIGNHSSERSGHHGHRTNRSPTSSHAPMKESTAKSPIVQEPVSQTATPATPKAEHTSGPKYGRIQ